MNLRKGFGFRALLVAGGLALLSQFVATPAWASYSAEISVNGVVTTTATSNTTPAIVSVPFDNSIDAADAVRISITGIEAGASVSVVASNALLVSALSTNLLPVRANAGTSQSTLTGVASAELFVYSTSTALASFTVTSGSTANTYYLRATAGPAYNIETTLPTTGFISSYSTLSLKVTDAFGNAVVGALPNVTAIGLTASAAPATDLDGKSQINLTYPTTAGSAALQVLIPATNVSGFAATKTVLSSIISIVDLAAELAAEKSALVSEKTAYDAEVARLIKLASDAKLVSDKAAVDAKVAYDAEVARLTKLAADVKVEADKEAAVAKALADKALADAKSAYDSEIARLTKLAADTKVATDKAAADAKTAADKSISDAKALQTQAEGALATLRTTTEARVGELNTAITKLNTDVTSLNTKLTAANTALATVDSKYKALVKKYNTLAKKYKQPTIKP